MYFVYLFFRGPPHEHYYIRYRKKELVRICHIFLIIKVPVGTVIREAESGKVMADITTAGEEKILIHGGKGGKGNQHFATPTRQAPRYAEPGRKSKEYDVILELKLIADVGLIGFPNVGKSTLLSMVTNANPKIAN